MDWFILGGYLLACILFMGAAALLRMGGRDDRQPFSAQHRLLRGPGESLRSRLLAQRHAELADIAGACLLPILGSTALFLATTRLDGAVQLIAFAGTAIILAAGLTLLARRLFNRIRLGRDLRLGYYGERVVAESLEPLKATGHLIYHDVPAGDPAEPFNIDHVIVGPSGVCALETKTRRQGLRGQGAMLREIIHDGQVLAFPWGEDRHGLDQALRRARWLEAQLASAPGGAIKVTPALTFPGWTIVRRAEGAVKVLAPSEIAGWLNAPAAPVLTPAQIRHVGDLLDARCRDVEY